MFNPAMLPNVAGGQVVSGEMALGEVAELKKALEMGYGTDVAQLTGGGAFRMQSLDATMKSTIQDNQHFTLFNRLQKTNATATGECSSRRRPGPTRFARTSAFTRRVSRIQHRPCPVFRIWNGGAIGITSIFHSTQRPIPLLFPGRLTGSSSR